MQAIPALRLSYANLLLQRLEVRGPARIDELLDGADAERLFKSDRQHRNPTDRAQDLLRFAWLVGLVDEAGRTYSLTPAGHTFVAAQRDDDPWTVTDAQAAVLRALLADGDRALARDTQLALAVYHDLISHGTFPGAHQFGRALAHASHSEQWRADRTFESQGARYRALLEEARFISASGEVTNEGDTLLTTTTRSFDRRLAKANVWWVNQGESYGRARDEQFIWAPLRDKAGRPQRHWDAMDNVAPGDVILHYSNSFLRATSIAQSTARPAENPLDSDSWQRDGRIIHTQYRELNVPIALASIPEQVRVPKSGPFTSVGSVQQGYLYRVDDALTGELADRFPELRTILDEYVDITPVPSVTAVTPHDLHDLFASAVSTAGLKFGSSNLIRSFISSLLAKPFVILTGLSGSGKTQVAMRLGEWFGQDDSGRPRSLILPVRPDWTGPEALFGFEDALRSADASRPVWFVPEALSFILRATAEPTHPYLLILDEMNLAHVERYFADFLSGIESRKGLLPDLVQDDGRGDWSTRSSSGTRLPLPRNLFVVGTVNIDETTYMFSPKVLDRASTFEFRVDAATLDPELGRPSAAAAAPSTVLRAVCDLAADDDWHRQNPHPEQESIVDTLRNLHAILAEADLEFGHRTFYESLRFAAFYAATGDDDIDNATDLIVMQKLLPKVNGSRRRIENVLTKLLAVSDGSEAAPRLPVTHSKLRRMLGALRANQFVSFTE
ncbi:McrB family protein [Pseudonocardia sp. MH-G8]|uniref:McrB family protein n=1 Tax=Pseudonocardia sp. MH-G8 TaxID=1854588 RepID=UPI001179B7E9|nr:hypothetical protein [Pseudonocardia sp. MH-G8]